MIQQRTNLKVIDNSFIGDISCIKVQKSGKKPVGKAGDTFLASVKTLRKRKTSILRAQKHLQSRGKKKNWERGDLVRAMFVSSKKSIDRSKGFGLKAKHQTGIRVSSPHGNLAVILSKDGKDFLASRIQGPVVPNLRAKNFAKAFALGGQTLLSKAIHNKNLVKIGMDRNVYFYKYVIARDLQSKVPLEKVQPLEMKSISLHLSFREGMFKNESQLLGKLLALEILCGQKPRLHFSKKAISHLNLRSGFLAGISVNLRSKAMYKFLEELRTFILPNVNGFEGIPVKSLNSKGSFGFSIENLIAFSALEEEYLNFQYQDPQAASSGRYFPLDIQFHTSARNLGEARALLSAFQLPVV